MKSNFVKVLAEAQGNICALCGRPFGFTWVNVDHVYPRSKNGRARHRNHVAAHAACNDRKGSRMPTGCEIIWLEAVNARLGEAAITTYGPLRVHAPRIPLPTLAEVWPP